MAEDMIYILGCGHQPRSRMNRSYAIEETPSGFSIAWTWTLDGKVVRVDQDILVDPKKLSPIKGELGWLPETKQAGTWEALRSSLQKMWQRLTRKHS